MVFVSYSRGELIHDSYLTCSFQNLFAHGISHECLSESSCGKFFFLIRHDFREGSRHEDLGPLFVQIILRSTWRSGTVSCETITRRSRQHPFQTSLRYDRPNSLQRCQYEYFLRMCEIATVKTLKGILDINFASALLQTHSFRNLKASMLLTRALPRMAKYQNRSHLA